MPLTSMVHVAARQTVPRASFGAGPTRPTAKALLDTIGVYIPADVTALYIPVAAGLVVAKESADTRRMVAVAMALLAAFVVLVLAHRTAQAAAKAQNKPPPTALATAKAGWYEILAAAVAFLVWAWAMPGSWHDFKDNQWWAPALAVGLASIVIGGVATLLNRDQG